jgi:hypothetical protein
MVKLAVAALRPHLEPTVFLDQSNDVSNLHSSELVAAVEVLGFLSNQLVVWQVET